MKCLICRREAVEGDRKEDAIEQSWGALPGVSYSCSCAAISCVRPAPSRPRDEHDGMQNYGWTASVSPCSEGDVDAR